MPLSTLPHSELLKYDTALNSRTRTWRCLILATHCGYIAVLLHRLSFHVGGKTWFVLLDDEMIAMRYARHLAHGAGLVWNTSGTHVEGFTNPLWTLLMAATHLLSIPPRLASLPVALLAVACLWTASIFANLVVEEFVGRSGPAGWAAQVLTLAYYPLNIWSCLGTEVAAVACMVTASIWLVIRAMRLGHRVPTSAWVLMGIATAIRLDSSISAAIVIMMLSLDLRRSRPGELLRGAAIVGGFVFAQEILRLLWFRDILPNTYYLKITGISIFDRAESGWLMFRGFVAQSCGWPLLLVPALSIALWPTRRAVLVLATVSACFIYSISVGGDAWEASISANRFICTAMPLFFSLFVAVLVEVCRRCSDVLQNRIARELVPTYLPALAVGLVPFAFNQNGIEAGTRQFFLASVPEPAMFGDRGVELASIVEQATTSRASVALTTVGEVPYFVDRNYIDLLGKVDARISHGPMHRNLGRRPGDSFYPGHSKWNYAYSVGELHPDMVVGPLWAGGETEAAPFLADYTKVPVSAWVMYVRKDSAEVNRAVLARLSNSGAAATTGSCDARAGGSSRSN